MAEMQDKCVTPARGPILSAARKVPPSAAGIPDQEVNKMAARVGKEAIDFEATAFIAGKGFQPVKLSDYKGKWVVVCFYPGDFTFV